MKDDAKGLIELGTVKDATQGTGWEIHDVGLMLRPRMAPSI